LFKNDRKNEVFHNGSGSFPFQRIGRIIRRLRTKAKSWGIFYRGDKGNCREV